jgi:hypothetical protein
MATQPRSERTEPAPPLAPVPASTPSADPDLNPARVLSAIALASIAAGAIHIAAAATLGSDSAQNLAFFAVVAAAQIVWGAVALARAPRWWLALGAAGNLIVLATWVVSRTIGLPVGEFAGVTLPVGFPDGLAAVLETVIVLGAVALLAGGVRRGPRLVPRASPSRPPCWSARWPSAACSRRLARTARRPGPFRTKEGAVRAPPTLRAAAAAHLAAATRAGTEVAATRSAWGCTEVHSKRVMNAPTR